MKVSSKRKLIIRSFLLFFPGSWCRLSPPPNTSSILLLYPPSLALVPSNHVPSPVYRTTVFQITLSSMIDADWTIGRERADIAGKILADALLNREQVRP